MEEKKNKKNLDSKHTLNFSFNEYCDGNKNIKEIVRNTHCHVCLLLMLFFIFALSGVFL